MNQTVANVKFVNLRRKVQVFLIYIFVKDTSQKAHFYLVDY